LTLDNLLGVELKTKGSRSSQKTDGCQGNGAHRSDSFDEKTYKSARNVSCENFPLPADVNTEQCSRSRKFSYSRGLEKLAERKNASPFADSYGAIK